MTIDEQAHKRGDWSYCPACGGSIDTGWECNRCGRDWMEYAATREQALHAQRKAVWEEAAKELEIHGFTGFAEWCRKKAQQEEPHGTGSV